jgi:hypothetical protein
MPKALALALFLAASPAAAASNADWEAMSPVYLKSLVNLLSGLETTSEHFHFVKNNDIDLKVVMPGLKVPEKTLGLYIDRESSMYLNRAMLLSGVKELRAKGVREKDIPSILAWKTLHIVVHEIRHGMNARGLVAEKGFRFPVSYLEDEYISFIDQIATIHEVLQVRPDLWDLDKILNIEKNVAVLLQAQKRSVEGIKRLVRAQPRYAKKPSVIELGRAGLLADVRRREERFDGLLSKHRREIRDKYRDPVERDRRLKIASKKYGPTLDDLRTGRKLLERREAYEALRSFVRREMKRAARKLEARRAG